MTPILRPETEPPVEGAGHALPGERRVYTAAERSLAGDTRGLARILPFLGPAFVASIAYVDPGNFATNIAAGSKYGYTLLWVILASNLMAMLVQSMSSKLGIATGRNLAEACRDRFPRPVVLALWGQAELIAMATDLAELIGAAIALNLLFGIPLLPAAVAAAITAIAILALQQRGVRHLEAVITGLLGLIVVGFAITVFGANPVLAHVAGGLVVPRIPDSEAALLSAGILGATVMPHVIYLHSALTQSRVRTATEEERRRVARFERIDVVIAMSIAGAVNMCMLITAAGAFHSRGLTGVEAIPDAFRELGRVVGTPAKYAFAVALLASGLSSSSVGTLAGQVVMQGFIQRSIPIFLRRAATIVPALIVVAVGVDPSRALVISQVALSCGIPFALIPLVIVCRDRRLMGGLVNSRVTNWMAYAVVAVIVALNGFLITQTFA